MMGEWEAEIWGAITFIAGISIIVLFMWLLQPVYALDSPQMDKSHCAPGVQGRCIEIKPPNPCGERR